MAQASGILDGHSATPIAQQSLPSRLVTIVRALGASPDRHAIMFLVGGIVVVICATAAAQERLNAWNQPFYDTLAQSTSRPSWPSSWSSRSSPASSWG